MLRSACVTGCFYKSKQSIKVNDFRSYRIWHTLWHITGPLCSTFVFLRFCQLGQLSHVPGSGAFNIPTCVNVYIDTSNYY